MTQLLVPHEDLLRRVRAEYLEMPGLRLTSAQARRLFDLDAATCEIVIDELVSQGFLLRTREGAIVRAHPEVGSERTASVA